MSDFRREARYYVIKIKDLSEDQDIALCDLLSGARIPCTDCVVVESDWPNYEHTWKTIERVSDSSYSDPYAEIERWKKTTHDQAETISELQGLVHQQRQGADICRCVGPGNGCCCDICEPSPPSAGAPSRNELIGLLLATQNESEGVTADLILGMINRKQEGSGDE